MFKLSDNIDIMPLRHKTIFILDHGSSFDKGCGETIDYDGIYKHRSSKASLISQLPPVEKAMWTCNVEAVMEYCRIVYDVLPKYYLIRIITCDVELNVLNEWDLSEQSTTFLMDSFASIGVMEPNGQPSLTACLQKAVEFLGEQSSMQQESLSKCNRVDNSGRIVILSRFDNDNVIASLEMYLQHCLNENNDKAAFNKNLKISEINIEFIDIRSVGEQTRIKEKFDISIKDLKSTVICSDSGKKIAQVLVQRCMSHYELGITSVTGIPMKEEQNAASSTNYDVELVHSKNAHSKYCRDTRPSFDLPGSEVVGLKWVPPKSSGQIADLQPSRVAYRVTPIDVNSRPSSCLTNFILSGRSVILEHTHSKQYPNFFLAAHSGIIYLHSTCKCPDIPGISEGVGGRLTDYRINDFGEFMMQTRLIPNYRVNGLKDTIDYFERHLRYWPLTQSESLLIHPHLQQYSNTLHSFLSKPSLTPDTFGSCWKTLTDLFRLESNNELIPPGVVSKNKKEEQLKQIWCQIEKMLRCYASLSESHQALVDKFLSVKGNYLLEADYPNFDDSDELDKEIAALFELKKIVTAREVYMVQNRPKTKKLKFEGILNEDKLVKLYPNILEKELPL